MSSTKDLSSVSLKRTFDEAGLDDGQDRALPSIGGRKHAHTAADAGVDDESSEEVGLETLPIEMLTKIAAYLSTPELLSLRLTSRTIEVKLFNDFAKYYFAKKQFMLTAESLQCLVDISLHPKLSTVLEHVIISVDSYLLGTAQTPDHFPGNDPDTKRARCKKYREGYYNQFMLLTTGRDRQLLTEAFRNLNNLKTVGLRDYNNGRRSRDGPDALWRAYGAGTVMRELGVSLLNVPLGISTAVCAGSGTPPDFAARAFVTLLQALGESGATPENVEILSKRTEVMLPEHAFQIPQYLEPTVATVLSGLKSLLLTADFAANQRLIPYPETSADDPIPKFLCLVPNLIHLRLNCQQRHAGIAHFLTWLASTDADSPTPLLPRLEQLDFGMFGVPYDKLSNHTSDLDPLSGVVERFGRTLKALNFWKITLLDSAAQADAMRQAKELRPHRWAELLAHLPRLAPGLDRLTVGALTQVCVHRSLHISIVSEVNAQDNLGDLPTARSYRREDMTNSWKSRTYRQEDMRDLGNFKALLEKELVVPWEWLPEMRTSRNGGDDDDEDDDDDDDEGDDEDDEGDDDEDDDGDDGDDGNEDGV
jgi:hypothetical protein